MADFGIVYDPNSVTQGPLVDAYQTIQLAVAYGDVFTPLEPSEELSTLPTVGQLYPK